MPISPATTENTTHLILCGGHGSRLGGVDKPLEEWRGRPLIEHIIDSTCVGGGRLVSVNRNLKTYSNYGDVFRDVDVASPAHGPLVGILGGLQRSKTEWLLVTPGDTPRLVNNWYKPMLAMTKTHASVVAHDGTQQQHLHLLLNRIVSKPLQEFLDLGNCQAYQFLKQIEPAVVHYANAFQFANFNTRDDFQ